MAVITTNVVAATSAVILYRNTTTTTVPLIITSHNNSLDVYVGGQTVTPSSNGIAVPKSQTFTFQVPAGETLYCAGNGTDTLRCLSYK